MVDQMVRDLQITPQSVKQTWFTKLNPSTHLVQTYPLPVWQLAKVDDSFQLIKETYSEEKSW
jgi:hypothetical protein